MKVTKQTNYWKEWNQAKWKRIQVISEDDEILTEEIEGLENDDEDILIWKSEDGEEKVIKHKGKGHKIMMFKNDNGVYGYYWKQKQ